MKRSGTREKFHERISQRINRVMENRGISQVDLLAMAEQRGYHLQQSTVSKILSSSASMSIVNVTQIADVLRIDLNDLLSLEDGIEVRVYEPKKKEEVKSRLIRRADSPEMIPYLNSYFTYMFPTLSSDEGIIEGRMRFYPEEDNSKCLVSFSFETGKVNSQNKPYKKEYSGELVLSTVMSAAYCSLVNEGIGEISYILFSYFPIIYEDLQCRVALVLTSSAGANRMPTAQRMIISKKQIPENVLSILQGQLYLNESEILISENGLKKVFEAAGDQFREYFERNENGTIFAGTSPVPYYLFDESIVRGSFLDSKQKNEAICLLRKYSASPKYNKVGTKCDEMLFNFVKSLDVPKKK